MILFKGTSALSPYPLHKPAKGARLHCTPLPYVIISFPTVGGLAAFTLSSNSRVAAATILNYFSGAASQVVRARSLPSVLVVHSLVQECFLSSPLPPGPINFTYEEHGSASDPLLLAGASSIYQATRCRRHGKQKVCGNCGAILKHSNWEAHGAPQLFPLVASPVSLGS